MLGLWTDCRLAVCLNSIIAGVHSEASRALIVRTSQSRTPSIQDYSLGRGHSISRFASCTDSSHRSAECDFLEWPGIPLMGCQVSPDRRGFDVPIMHLWGFEDGLAVRLEIVLDVPTMQAALEP